MRYNFRVRSMLLCLNEVKGTARISPADLGPVTEIPELGESDHPERSESKATRARLKIYVALGDHHRPPTAGRSGYPVLPTLYEFHEEAEAPLSLTVSNFHCLHFWPSI